MKPFSASDDDFAKLSFDEYLDDIPFTVNEVLLQDCGSAYF